MFSGVQIFVLFLYLNLDTTKCLQDIPPPSPLNIQMSSDSCTYTEHLRTVRLAQNYSKMPLNPFAGNFYVRMSFWIAFLPHIQKELISVLNRFCKRDKECN
jgi:hypothetical protein